MFGQNTGFQPDQMIKKVAALYSMDAAQLSQYKTIYAEKTAAIQALSSRQLSGTQLQQAWAELEGNYDQSMTLLLDERQMKTYAIQKSMLDKARGKTTTAGEVMTLKSESGPK